MGKQSLSCGIFASEIKWRLPIIHDGPTSAFITWWRHPRHWLFVRGIHRSPVNSPHKGQWHGALMYSLICAWNNIWANNGDVGIMRRHRAHHDVTVVTNHTAGLSSWKHHQKIYNVTKFNWAAWLTVSLTTKDILAKTCFPFWSALLLLMACHRRCQDIDLQARWSASLGS